MAARRQMRTPGERTSGAWTGGCVIHPDGRFMGPCSIAKKWAPYEISIVSVPADPTVGVGREMEEKSEPGTQDIPLDIYERQLQINKNRMEVKENDD